MALKFSKCLFLLAPVASILLVGCHCVEVSERYGDRVDKIADRQLALDRFYRPSLDLTRICHDCKKQDAVCHRPVMYPDSRVPSQAPTEPTLPAVQPVEELETPKLEAPNLIPPVPPASQPLETTSKTDWQKTSDILGTTIGVGAIPFELPKRVNKNKVVTPGIRLTTSQELGEWAQPIEIPAMPEVVSPVAFPLFKNPSEATKELSPRTVEPISAPAGVPPSQQFYRSLKSQE